MVIFAEAFLAQSVQLGVGTVPGTETFIRMDAKNDSQRKILPLQSVTWEGLVTRIKFENRISSTLIKSTPKLFYIGNVIPSFKKEFTLNIS